ncbi:universal stress protein [bacterium]|nr:universal stress protein [bacterium]
MYTHILYPTDLSPVANEGFATAVDLARTLDARITLLNVHEEFMDAQEMQSLRVSVENYQEMMKNKAVSSREKMQEMLDENDAASFGEILLREGKPRKEIVTTAKEIGADLIVMTSNGRSNLAQHVIGSVAEHVVRTSSLPILVIKAED